jgi:NADPH:quinone reductase-like Zn-dependent oxidoreductase
VAVFGGYYERSSQRLDLSGLVAFRVLTGTQSLSLGLEFGTKAELSIFRAVRLKHNPSDLKALADLVTEGKLKPLVDSVYSFDDVHAAYERIMTSRARGKVVVKVDPSVE